MVVLHRRDASFKVLHWPKLFEGRVSQEGQPAYDGFGGGYSAGMANIFGYINGGGRGRGYGYSSNGDGFGDGYSGYGYSSNGDGFGDGYSSNGDGGSE
jgi:hypothetical protein